jgi:hypothetical protein
MLLFQLQSIQQDMAAGQDRERALYKRKIEDLKSLMAADGMEMYSLFRKAGFSSTTSFNSGIGADDNGIWDADFSRSSARPGLVVSPDTYRTLWSSLALLTRRMKSSYSRLGSTERRGRSRGASDTHFPNTDTGSSTTVTGWKQIYTDTAC